MIEQGRPGKIFVGGLAGDVDKDTLENAFDKYGRITEVLIIRDKVTNQSRGFGFVTYENPLDAEDAVKGMDGQTVLGKEVHVEPAVASVNEDRDTERGPPRSSRGGFKRGGPPMRSRGTRGGFLSRQSSSGMSGRRDFGRRSSPPMRRDSMSMRSRGRGGPPLRGRSSSFRSRDMSPQRKGPFLQSPSQRFSDGPSMSRRGGTFNSSPPRRFTSDFDRRDDRFGNAGFSDRLQSRSRDMYSSPPRETSRNLMDSRMTSGRSAGRDYGISRDYMPQRSHTSRAISPEPMRRMPMQRDSYTTSGRDDRRESFRTSNASRDYMSARSGGMGGDYMNSRDSGRDYASSRDYGSTRDFQSTRDYGGRFDSHDMGQSSRYTSRDMESRAMPNRGSSQRGYDSYNDGQSARTFNGPGGSRAPLSRSGPSFSSRGGGSLDRRESRGDSGGMAGMRRSGPSLSRGPPPMKRSRMDGPSMKRDGPPMRR